MTTIKRFTTNGYKIYDKFHDGVHWLVNEVEADEIVDKMNNLDLKARERSKALSRLQKENDKLKQEYNKLKHRHSLLHDVCIEAECDRDRYHKDVLSLEKENEQLKKIIKDHLEYNPILDELGLLE